MLPMAARKLPPSLVRMRECCTSVQTMMNVTLLIQRLGIDKQKVLLSGDAGHFSLIKALHLADLITELNGMLSCPCLCSSSEIQGFANRCLRVLWCHVHLLVDEVLSGRAKLLWQFVCCIDFHAVRAVFRLYGWKGCEMEKEEQSYGTGAGFVG
jgi:hypothetical protein